MGFDKFLKNKTIFIIVLALIIAGVVWARSSTEEVAVSSISNFEECAEAGYPILESYPDQCKTPDGRTFTQDIGNELEKIDLIRIDSPRPNNLIKSPLNIDGEARGNWFFEANFPIRILDDEGNEIAEGFAEAQGEWMTEEFVPFTAELIFDIPESSKGSLILEKANPSGLSENEDFLIIPVKFE